MKKISPNIAAIIIMWTCTSLASEPILKSDGVAAFARLFGVVRYYHPGDAIQELDWNSFSVYGVEKVHAARDAGELAVILRDLFNPLAIGIQVIPSSESFSSQLLSRTGQTEVYWQRIGYAEGVNRNAFYQSKRVGRPGVFVLGNHDSRLDVVQLRTKSWQLMQPTTKLFEDAPKEQYVDFKLGVGLKARVPIVLADKFAQSTLEQKKAVEGVAAARKNTVGGTLSANERMADVVVSWNVYRHFYPYWKEVGVDWDAKLKPLLELVDGTATRADQFDSLSHLVSLVKDGHGFVYDVANQLGMLPIKLEPVGDALVVTATAVPEVEVGDRIVSIDGRDFTAWVDREEPLISGSPQWHRWQLARALCVGPVGSIATLGFDREGKGIVANLSYERNIQAMSNSRPGPVEQMEPGTWYLDITRASLQDLNGHIELLSKAHKIIVDLRGYPTPGTGIALLRHLLGDSEHGNWMHTPKYNAPFDQPDGYLNSGWNLEPLSPRLTAKIFVVTDGRAISQAESVLGYFADLHLATIVGLPSAGTNGDVQSFSTPSGFSIRFTALLVTHHDGVTPLHLQGISPDVQVAPTVSDIRAGRDVVLERALKMPE